MTARDEHVAQVRDLWNQRYDDPRYLFGYRPNDFLVQVHPMLKRQGHVLVVGDGEGRNGVWLAERGHQVTTVDVSHAAVEKARRLADERGVGIDAHEADLVGWLSTADADGPWDGVVWIFVHLPPDDRAEAARLLTDRLAPDGRLVMENYSTAQPQFATGGPKDEALLLTRERVRADWPGLDLDVRLTERRIFEGYGHRGLASVVQVLGQRRREG